MRFVTMTASLVLSILFCGTQAQGSEGGQDVHKIAIDQVTTVRAQGHALTRQVPIYGNVESANDAILRFPVAGIVRDVKVIDAQTVDQGALLVELDSSEFKQTLAELKDNISQLDRKIQLAQDDVKKHHVQSMQNQHALALAQQHLSKQKRLHVQRIITDAQFEEAAFRLDQRQSMQLQASYQESKSADKLAMLESRKRITQRSLRDAQRWTQQGRLLAPFKGRIEKIHVQSGQRVMKNEPILSLFDHAQMRIRAVVSHAEVRELKLQLAKKNQFPVKIVWDDQSIDGRVIDILPYSISETLGVDILVDVGSEVDRRIQTPRRGMMIVPTERRLFTLPADAIQDGAYVVKVSASGKIQRAAVTKIRPATANQQHVVVESEQLQSGDEIVVASKVPVHVGDQVIRDGVVQHG